MQTTLQPANELTQEQYDKLKDCLVVGMITFRGKFVRRTNAWAWIAVRTNSGKMPITKYRVQEVMIEGKYLEYKRKLSVK